MSPIRYALEFVRTNWRSWVLTGIGALILWAGFYEIVDTHEAYALVCEVTSPYGRCRGIHTELLGLIIVIAAVCFPTP